MHENPYDSPEANANQAGQSPAPDAAMVLGWALWLLGATLGLGVLLALTLMVLERFLR